MCDYTQHITSRIHEQTAHCKANVQRHATIYTLGQCGLSCPPNITGLWEEEGEEEILEPLEIQTQHLLAVS